MSKNVATAEKSKNRWKKWRSKQKRHKRAKPTISDDLFLICCRTQLVGILIMVKIIEKLRLRYFTGF